MVLDVPQRSILGPILFNIFISDYFLVVKDVNFASYANDNAIYKSGKTVEDVINDLQVSAEKRFKWFCEDQMKEKHINLMMSYRKCT